MNISLGIRTHSGWAAIVAAGQHEGEWTIIARERLSMVDDAYAKAPYHAAENLSPEEARSLVDSAFTHIREVSYRNLRALVTRLHDSGHSIQGCAVLTGAPMPAWTTDEILAVHFRMHKAEGVLFQQQALRAAEDCGLTAIAVPEKQLKIDAAFMAALGKKFGPPWGADQKSALAAIIAAYHDQR